MKRILLFLPLFFTLYAGAQVNTHRPAPKMIPPSYAANSHRGPVVPGANFVTSCTVDTILITSQAQIDNFSSTHPSCTNPKYLLIDGSSASPAITNLNGLSSITAVINKLQISNTSITGLSALSNLTMIGDSLNVDHCPLLTSIGLNNLTQLGSILFRNLPQLTSIAGLSNHLTSINNIYIDTTALTTLTGLQNIDSVHGHLQINFTPLLNLSSLTSLRSVDGWIWLESDTTMTSIGLTNLHKTYFFVFSNLPHVTNLGPLTYHLDQTNVGTFIMSGLGVTDLSGLDSLTSVPNFYVSGNQSMTSLHGLEHLSGNIGGGFSIYYNPQLTNLSALSNIDNINNGGLELSYNFSLSNLNGLQNITHIGGLRIAGSNLDSLGMLNHALVIDQVTDDSVQIYDNNHLSVCGFQPICNYLQAGHGADIYNNDPGCEDLAAVVSVCNIVPPLCPVTTDATWNGQLSGDWDDPDNWTPSGVPGMCTKVTIPSDDINYTPYANHDISIGGLIMLNNSSFDMEYYNLDVTGTFSIDNASIYSVPHLTASSVYMPLVQGAYIDGNFKCLNFGGESKFCFNNFEGDVTLSDSTGRQQGCQMFLNNVYGNLACNVNTEYGQFYLANASPGHDFVQGNLTINNNSTGNFSVGLGGLAALEVQGNFVVNSPNGPTDINSLTMSGGNSVSHITQTGAVPMVIKNLHINRNWGVVLDQELHVTDFLSLDQGTITTAPDKLLVAENNTYVTQSSNGATMVLGPMKKIGNQAFTFPIGKIEQNTYRDAPIKMSAPANATDAFTAEYFHHDPTLDGYDTSHAEPGFGGISGNEYWKLTRDSGTSNVKIGLSFSDNRSASAYLYQYAQVAGWNGTAWKNWSTSGNTGSIYSGYVNSLPGISQFGAFAISNKGVKKPIITLGDVDTVHCAGYPFFVKYTLDTLAVTGNSFRVEVSDTAGNFNTFFNPSMGSKTSNRLVDSIPVVMPYYLTYGRNYKIRIVGDFVPDTSVNTKTIKAYTYPQLAFNIVGNITACGGSVQKYYPSVHEAGVNYNWATYGGNTITTVGDTAFITWNTPGSYVLTATAANICGTGQQRTVIVEVKAPATTETPSINNTGRWIYSSQAPAATTYQWYRNGAAVSGATNSSYYASLAGNYIVKFENYCGASPASNTISFAAASVPQTITFPAIPNKTYGDGPFVPAATASSGLPVSFTLVSGPADINAQTNVLTITGTGVVTIIAKQSGSNVYDTAAPVTRSFTVNKASQLITFTNIPDQDYRSTTVAVSATSSSGLAVNYSIASGPAAISGNVVTFTGIGTVTVKASQPGDANYLPAADATKSFCVNIAALDPIAGFTNLCPGTATYSVNNVPGATYHWSIIGGSAVASTTNSANITWSTPGNYSLLVYATGNCGAASATDTLNVHVINSIQPDSVHSMLPANGAVNQQLPLTLSWVPAQPGSFYTFDVYVWPSSQAQPSTPYVSNISSVNYTIPLNSGLPYNQSYKWMVVAHNGSCTVIHTGPVQLFSLIPLPDLAVSNVQIPATAFSGQNITINWTVSNVGPGITTTNQSWTDAVFLSFDDHPNFSVPPNTNPGGWNHLDFPVRPLLVGTKPNVSALNSNEQYTNSINFTLPVNYSQPLYAYVVTNYPAGANAPVQVTVTNDTAHAPQPIAVTLSPAPDLRVDTVFSPATTFSGSTINLSYKVKNYGVLTPAATQWVDKVYISQSPFFDVNTATQLTYPKANGSYYAGAQPLVVGNGTQLQADSSYTRSIQAVIPNFIFGSYFIYVVTNATGSVYEGPANANNVNRAPVQVFLTPTPHLTVSSLTVPVASASVTQPVSVSWNIANTGFNDNIEKSKGHYMVANGTCLIPVNCGCIGQPGCSCPGPIFGIGVRDSLSFGSSYWIDKAYLSTDPNGLDVNSAILVTQANQGFLNSGLDVSDNLSASDCKPVGYNPSIQNINTFNVIKPGSNHPKTASFTVPADLAPGNYYVYLFTNSTKAVYEYPGTNEIRRSDLPIQIQRPDATVPAVSVPAASTGGQSITVGYTVLNNGPGAVFNSLRNDRIYMSTSSVFNGTAQLIGTQSFTESLPVGTGVQHTFAYALPPATSGGRYFFVHTNFDSTFRETNQLNNISSPATTTVTPGAPSDFVVTAAQLADPVYSAFNTPIKYTVVNNGAAAAGQWKDSIFISCSPTFNQGAAYYVAERLRNQSVAPSASYTDSFAVSLPMSYLINSCFTNNEVNTAYFFIKTNANNGIYEGANTGNNVFATGSRTFINSLVDQIVTTVTGADTATVGRPYNTAWTVKNLGVNPATDYYNYWNDAIYFSPDSVLTANAVLATYFGQNTRLGTNQTYNDSKNITVPNIPTGDYYVLTTTNAFNNILAEKALSNNTNTIRNVVGAAKLIHVIQPVLPDLTDSITSLPAAVAVGQPLIITHRVTNAGAGPTFPASWSDDVYLSSDFIPGNAGDVYLSGKTHNGALAAGGFYNDTVSAGIALNTVPGNYVLISRTNSNGTVFETNSNNNLAFKYINVYSPAPSDLVVQNIIRPDTVFLGYTVDTAKWVIQNNSPNTASGFTSDGIYLSQSNVFDSTAILIGVKNKNINMAPLAADTVRLAPLVNNLTEGSYNVFVRADLLNNIVETNKVNNTGLAAGKIYVGVKELPMNVLTPNTLFNINRYYKLIIPDSLSGSTIQVVLKSADSLTMKNQLFIGKGYVPSPANFDYAYSTPNYGNQDIVITSVTAGTYYISVRAASPNPVVQNITLKAVKLPFAILNVQSSSGGNIGNVTVKISGSLFTNNMTAKLSKSGTIINASAVYFTNSTIVYATFNLQGKPLGIYDVTLTKPDTTTAVLAGGFSVVAANNGGLNNGGGTNTGSGNGNDPGCDPGAAGGLNSQLVTEMVIPDKVFGGWVFVIQINYSNPTNVDIPAQTRTLYSLDGLPVALDPGSIGTAGTSLYMQLTEQNGPPGIIRAGGSGTITVYCRAPITFPAHQYANFELK